MREVIITTVIGVVIFFALSLFLVKRCNTMVKEAGGTRNIIVETGKEIKSIIKDIDDSD